MPGVVRRFIKVLDRGERNCCSRCDLIFRPLPSSSLAKKREERARKPTSSSTASSSSTSTHQSMRDDKPREVSGNVYVLLLLGGGVFGGEGVSWMLISYVVLTVFIWSRATVCNTVIVFSSLTVEAVIHPQSTCVYTAQHSLSQTPAFQNETHTSACRDIVCSFWDLCVETLCAHFVLSLLIVWNHG